MRTGQGIVVESALKVIKRLKSHGFTLVRCKGSHHQFICNHGNGCHHLVTVAVHKGKDVSDRDIRSIIRQSGLSKEEFYN